MTDGRELDDDLRAALRAEDAELLARIEEDPGMADLLRSGFRGRMAWWVLLTSCAQLCIFGLGVWSCVEFVTAGGVDDRVFWGTWMLLAMIATGTTKLMIWNHVERNMILREVKRVELQVATLSLRLLEKD